MIIVAIPTHAYEEITRRLEDLISQLAVRPSEEEIADIRAQLVSVYAQYGMLPEMTLQKVDKPL